MQSAGAAINFLPEQDSSAESARASRFTDLVHRHLAPVYRLLRHLGVPASDVEDAAQQVFLVLSRKLAGVAPGAERGFISGTAVRIASRWRRTHRRRREEGGEEPLSVIACPHPSPERRLEQTEAEVLLEQVLAELGPKTREVFVLYEIEQLTLREIAEALELPSGTVASRLRIARQQFHWAVAALNSRLA